MFFGNGTVDPIVGIKASYAFEAFRLASWANVRAPLYENRFGYQGPTQITGGLGVDTGFGLETWRFLLQPEIYHETPATWAGEPARNSGRTDLIAAAGVYWLPSADWTVHLLAKVPWTVRAEGGQLRMPFVGLLGVTYAFNLWQPSP